MAEPPAGDAEESERNMTRPRKKDADDADMRDEYDFSKMKSVPNPHYKRLQGQEPCVYLLAPEPTTYNEKTSDEACAEPKEDAA